MNKTGSFAVVLEIVFVFRDNFQVCPHRTVRCDFLVSADLIKGV